VFCFSFISPCATGDRLYFAMTFVALDTIIRVTNLLTSHLFTYLLSYVFRQPIKRPGIGR